MTSITESRHDLYLTSTGRGHEYRNGLAFPPVEFQRSALCPLPNSLTSVDNVHDFYITTTGSTHDYKASDASIKGIYKKAPGHWSVKYVEDTIKKLNMKPQKTPLAMGFQSSEMKSQYQGKTGISTATQFSSNLQPPLFQDHNSNGPLKSLVASGQNPELGGQMYNIQDRGVLNYHGDLYLSTTQKDHRSFTREERSQYPRKDYATFWECENYPKAWGHGSKHNPLPLDSIPREKGPMRDHTWFRTATTIPRIPKQMEPVPHKGLHSEVTANFKAPTNSERNELFYCPVPKPWKQLPGPGQEEISSVPKMYKTEYQSYSYGKPVLV